MKSKKVNLLLSLSLSLIGSSLLAQDKLEIFTQERTFGDCLVRFNSGELMSQTKLDIILNTDIVGVGYSKNLNVNLEDNFINIDILRCLYMVTYDQTQKFGLENLLALSQGIKEGTNGVVDFGRMRTYVIGVPLLIGGLTGYSLLNNDYVSDVTQLVGYSDSQRAIMSEPLDTVSYGNDNGSSDLVDLSGWDPNNQE